MQEHIDPIISMVEADAGRVNVEGDAIVVTLPGTGFRVVYRKPAGEPGLIASDVVRNPNMTLAQQTEFLAGAWRLANNQARALGWIV
jgi:hypothetical protein